MTATARQAMKLPRRPDGKFQKFSGRVGVGIVFLFVGYGWLSAALLTRCLHDEGSFSRSTRALYT